MKDVLSRENIKLIGGVKVTSLIEKTEPIIHNSVINSKLSSLDRVETNQNRIFLSLRSKIAFKCLLIFKKGA